MFKDERKRLLFIIPSLRCGGAERVLLNILQYLDRRKFKPYLVLFETKGEFLAQIPSDVTICYLNKKSRFDFFKMIFLLAYKVYPKVKPHVVISSMEYSNLIALISKKVSWVKPSILISEHTYNNSCLDQRMRKLKTLLMKKFYPKTDKMITVSKAIAENLIKSHEISQ
jgi:hypothetical protein